MHKVPKQLGLPITKCNFFQSNNSTASCELSCRPFLTNRASPSNGTKKFEEGPEKYLNFKIDPTLLKLYLRMVLYQVGLSFVKNMKMGHSTKKVKNHWTDKEHLCPLYHVLVHQNRSDAISFYV
jgi:hypothetical protein